MQVIVYGLYAIGSRPLVYVCEGSGGGGGGVEKEREVERDEVWTV